MSAWKRFESGADAEALHDFRVEVRRMRSLMRAFRPQLKSILPKALRRRLRAIARATNESRDLEVQLQWLAAQKRVGARMKIGASWLSGVLIERQKLRHTKAASNTVDQFAEVHRDISAVLGNGTRDDRGDKTAGIVVPFALLLGQRVARLASGLEKNLNDIGSITDQDEAHRARIAGKRLRYLLEPLEDSDPRAKVIVDRLKDLQDTVGAMRDASLMRDELHGMLGPRSATMPFEEATLPPAEARAGLALIAARLQADEARGFQKLRSRWSRPARRDFFRRAAEYAAALQMLAAVSRESVEVERKFLLSALPPRSRKAKPIEIDQGWLPGKKLAERVRRSRSGGRTQYFRTVKLGTGLRRIEIEERTTKAVFDVLWPLTEGKRVRKTRYPVRDGGLTWELDQFRDRKLVLAEVELEDESISAKLPRWLKPYVVREVTGEAKYVNWNLGK